MYTNYANHSLKIMHAFDENNVMKNNFIGNTEKKGFLKRFFSGKGIRTLGKKYSAGEIIGNLKGFCVTKYVILSLKLFWIQERSV